MFKRVELSLWTAMVVAIFSNSGAFANNSDPAPRRDDQEVCPKILKLDGTPSTRVSELEDLQKRYNKFQKRESAEEYAFYEDHLLVKDPRHPGLTEHDEVAVIFADREEGLRQIRTTVAVTEREHSWMFIPEKQMWINSAAGVDTFDVTDKKDLSLFLLNEFSVLEHYHTHPNYSAEMAFGLTGPMTINFLAEAAQPSEQDLVQCWANQIRAFTGHRFIGQVVSHFGVTSFQLKPDIRIPFEGLERSHFNINFKPWPEP